MYGLDAFLSQQHLIGKLAQFDADLLQSLPSLGSKHVELAPMPAILSVLHVQVSGLLQAVQRRVEGAWADALVAMTLQLGRHLRAIHRTLLGVVQDVNSDEAAEEFLQHTAPFLWSFAIGIRYRYPIA